MKKLSSITIAKNEEVNLVRCLKSLRNVVDEIVVVVDSASEDETLKIARENADVVEVAEWRGYSETKELAVEKCANEWILWIDADEELTSELKNELLTWKSEDDNFQAYEIARRAFFLGKWIKHCGWYPGYVTRLFNKNKCRFSQSAVHEFLYVQGETGRMRNDLNHYTDPDIRHYFQKFNNYTTLASEELFAEGRTAGINDLIIRPAFLFIKMFILRGGFLDGVHGLALSVLSSAYVFTKYAKLWEKQINKLRL